MSIITPYIFRIMTRVIKNKMSAKNKGVVIGRSMVDCAAMVEQVLGFGKFGCIVLRAMAALISHCCNVLLTVNWGDQ